VWKGRKNEPVVLGSVTGGEASRAPTCSSTTFIRIGVWKGLAVERRSGLAPGVAVKWGCCSDGASPGVFSLGFDQRCVGEVGGRVEGPKLGKGTGISRSPPGVLGALSSSIPTLSSFVTTRTLAFLESPSNLSGSPNIRLIERACGF
jgi:hypothetical protein